MFYRKILDELDNWRNSKFRKPLILRGARQVGKTTAVEMFSKNFRQFIHLNLDKVEDKNLFERNYSFEILLEAIFLYKDANRNEPETLIFIDEIQNSPEAVRQLRYFYEEAPELFVISAGSLLESLIDNTISFPVGRVEYLVMKPVCFTEYLHAVNADAELQLIHQIPCSEYAHEKLLNHFYSYALVGGMPEVIERYLQTKDIHQLKPVYEALLTAYLDDIEKYSSSDSQVKVLRHSIKSVMTEAGKRIVYQGFGNSNYRSREISEAMMLIERAMLIQLIYPVTQTILPIAPDFRKSPKLQLFDTGLLNYFSGVQKDLFLSRDIMQTYHGRIAEHIAGQELSAISFDPLFKNIFWTREKRQSKAEVDFIYQYENLLIPVEVKTASTGHLKSLHIYMNSAPHDIAVRIYSGALSEDKITTSSGKSFRLLNLPFYLINEINNYIKWLLS